LLFLSLFAKSFQSLFDKFFASSFGSLSAALAVGFWPLTFGFLLRPRLPPGRSLGHPLPGRIVVRVGPHYYT